MATVTLETEDRQIELVRLGRDEVLKLCGNFIQAQRAHLESITASLPAMERAVVIRDGLPAFVPRGMLFDYTQTVQGASESVKMALELSGIPPADVPAILRTVDYDQLTEVAARLVFRPLQPKPAEPGAGAA